MSPRLQKLGLLAHVAFSVGWFGAVIPYIALAVAALTSRNEQFVRAACLSMEFIGWFVIVPLSLGALMSGLVQSLGTRWGLFRHWWIVGKLILTVFATVVLLQHMREVSRVAFLAGKSETLPAAVLRPELIHSVGGLLVLLAAMALSMFRPWGMTPYGQKRAAQSDLEARPINQRASAHAPIGAAMKRNWRRIVGYHAIALLVLFVIAHVALLRVTGMRHH